MKNCAIQFTFIFIFLSGCGDSGGGSAPAEAYSLKAASLLKKYQSAQQLHRVQSDGFGTMKNLIDKQLIVGELVNAYDKQATPVPADGYLFSEIEQESDGQPLNRHNKAGLCAYPQSGSGEGILMLLDIKDSQEWSFYTCDYAKVGGAVRRWPGAKDFKDKFVRSTQYSTQEAAKQAEKLTQ